MDTNFLSRVVGELVVCTTKYLPVTGEGRVRGDEIACRVTISISYFSVVDGGPISRRRLNAHRSTVHPGMIAQQCVEHRTSTTNSYAPCPSGMK